MVSPKPSGFATTKEGKRKIVERTKALVDEKPSAGMTALRAKL